MSRLPVVGGDDNTWGNVLNDFLGVEHNADGSQKTLSLSKGGTGATNAAGALSNLGAASTSALAGKEDTANKGAANGYAPLDSSKLLPTTNLPLSSLDSRYVMPVVFSRSGTLSVVTGAGRYPAPQASSIVGVQAAVGTAPAGASIIVDVNLNDSTVFTTQANRPTIAAGTNTSSQATPDVTSLAAGDLLSVNVAQVGSTTAGSDLTVVILIKAG